MKIIKTAGYEKLSQQMGLPPAGGDAGRLPVAPPPSAPAAPAGPSQQPQMGSAAVELMHGEDPSDAVSQWLQESGAIHVTSEGHGYPGHGGGFHDMGNNFEIETSPVTIDYTQSGLTDDDMPELLSGSFWYTDPNTGARVQVEWRGTRSRKAADQQGHATYIVH